MRLHPKAKTTPSGRWLLVRRIEEECWTVRQAAEASAISVRTAYEWLSRFRNEGRAGLADRSSRPCRIPRRAPARLVRRVEQLRRRRMTTWEISERASLPASTVSLILRREAFFVFRSTLGPGTNFGSRGFWKVASMRTKRF